VELDISTKFEFGPKAIRSGLRLARIAKEGGFGVIHAHTRVSQVAASIASRISGAKVVTTCHGYFRKRLRGIVDTWGDRVVAISGAVKEHLTKDLHVAENRVALIYSGVDASRFRADSGPDGLGRVRAGLGLAEGPVIGTIGRLSPVKGQRFFIESMAHILARRPDAQAVILGNGPEEAALRKLAASTGAGGRIFFFASSADTGRFLSAMDVFVFPSLKEGLGIALLEALAAGRACVASDTGGIGDIIEDGHTGLLVAPGDPKAIAEAVLKLLADGALRSGMGRKGRELVAAKFTVDAMADRMAGLYNEVGRSGR
jgi:glycosyltransferase involved in cell wall biosynthesis